VPLETGQNLDGKYRVVRMIGEGGMGTVYEGENVRIGRRVAIKVLHAEVASRPEFAARFEREARAAARIGSPHICDVLDFGDLPNGERFIVMEYLEGESFEQRLTRVGRIPGDALLPIAFEMLDALATMHAAGVIHRDLKPANVFLARTAQGRGEIVKLLDFGVSKFVDVAGDTLKMTSTGVLMGTPLYMSPEQARGARDIDARSDVYAASVVFYRALTGSLPFEAENFNELMFKIVLEDAKPIRDRAPDVHEELAAIVTKGLARAPDARWESAAAYQKAFVQWARKQGRTSLALFTSPSEKALVTAVEAPASAMAPATPAASSAKEGTPMGWSEDGPVRAKVSSGTLVVAATVPSTPPPFPPAAPQPPVAVTKASVHTPGTSEAVAASATPAAPAAPVPSPAPPRRPSRAPWIVMAAALGTLTLAGAGALAIRSASSRTVASASAPVASSAVEPPASAPEPSAEPAPTATDPAASASSVAPPPPSLPGTPSPRILKPPPRATATSAPSATAPAPASAAPSATAAPTATSSSGKPRKFRTNID
jgi:serine/threonine-protein kinase